MNTICLRAKHGCVSRMEGGALAWPRLDEMGETFEEIEHGQFGKDGFEDAVAQISAIEQALGVADLERFTAPPPAKL